MKEPRAQPWEWQTRPNRSPEGAAYTDGNVYVAPSGLRPINPPEDPGLRFASPWAGPLRGRPDFAPSGL